MEGKSEEIPTVKLSPFRFTDWLKPPDATSNDSGAKNGEPKLNNITSQSYWGPQPPLDYRRPEAYERMAADKPGEELAHDATIWKLYLEEAEEHDRELVQSRHGSLDMLLLFAALFSAILTAFLIESKDLLQQDPADASAALLLMVVQSQQRIELGLPSPVDAPLDDLPAFIPSASARWINGIWFISLALSLSAALLAMLGKEWLTAYLASRPRPAHSHALLRQARLEGLEHWWALHIIALLPSLLHMSLFLFAVGLVVYLSTLDPIIAGVMAGVIGITSLFYLVTAVLGALYEHCPFVTQVSGYIKRAFDRYLRRPFQDEDISNFTSLKDLQALLWLANNARDPAVADCSFQSLAGLRTRSKQTLQPSPDSSQAGPGHLSQTPPSLPVQINAETTFFSLFRTVINRFEKALSNPLSSSIADGLILARYAAAMVQLFDYLPRIRDDNQLSNESNGHNLGVTGNAKPGDHTTQLSVDRMTPSSSVDVLTLLEGLWSDNAPSFSANAYTGFLTAQLELLNFAASFHARDNNNIIATPMDGSFSLTHGLATVTRSTHVIDIAIGDPESPHRQQLADLRACYSRTLCRITYFLWLNYNQTIKVETSALLRLLNAMRTIAGCKILNPESSVSTHHAQRSTNMSSPFRFHLSAFNETGWLLAAEDLYAGPLGRLIDILGMKPDIPEVLLLQLRITAAGVFSVLAPVLLQQVLSIDRAELCRELSFRTWSDLPILDMDGIRYVVARQMLLVLRYLGPKLGSAGAPRFCPYATGLIRGYMIESTKYAGARAAVSTHGADLVPLLESMDMNISHFSALPQLICLHLTDIAQTSNGPRMTPCETLLPPSCFPVLVRVVARSSMAPAPVKAVLQSMVSRIRSGQTGRQLNIVVWNNTPAIEYLNCFTHTAKGFSAFLEPAANEYYRGFAVETISELVHLAANRQELLGGARNELNQLAVPGFLEIVSVVARHCSGNLEYQKILLDFSQDVVKLLEVAAEDPESRGLIMRHPSSSDLCSALETINNIGQGDSKVDPAKLPDVGLTAGATASMDMNGARLGESVAMASTIDNGRVVE